MESRLPLPCKSQVEPYFWNEIDKTHTSGNKVGGEFFHDSNFEYKGVWFSKFAEKDFPVTLFHFGGK